MPVQIWTKLDMVANARTARLLGRRIPQTILVRADEVINKPVACNGRGTAAELQRPCLARRLVAMEMPQPIVAEGCANPIAVPQGLACNPVEGRTYKAHDG